MPINFGSIDKLLNTHPKPSANKINSKVRKRVKKTIKPETVRNIVKNNCERNNAVQINEVKIAPENNLSKKPKAPKDILDKDMSGSLFRFINEKLSFSDSHETDEFFKNDPAAFEIYHKGFGNQRDKWPEDPMDWIKKQIKKVPKYKSAIVADFGCGDGRLSRAMSANVQKFYSYDFVSNDDVVTQCDISNVPLEDESVNAVVISLALMGTNCCEYIAEANRILKTKGSLILVELVSRMKSPGSFIKKVKKMGFERSDKDGDSEKIRKTDYFMKLHLTKVGACDRDNLPDLQLKPVLYKKR